MANLPFLDYSQYYAWNRCPGFWFEQSVSKRVPKRDPGQRSDPLCIGSLVHAGLENWQLTRTIGIPEATLLEMNPTKETLDMCLGLVYGYSQHYPEESWPLLRTEEPLRFPLVPYGTDKVGNQMGIDGLAKVDAYFYVPELATLESGVFGQTISLSSGWWVHEYKTKTPEIDLGMWMREWQSNMQASFQMLALQYNLDNNPDKFGVIPPHETHPTVQGVLINILEKPKLYTPKRKCKVCEIQYDYDLWVPVETLLASCPICGNIQKIAKLKENPVTSKAHFYRMCVQRSPERLQRDKNHLYEVASQMSWMREKGLYSIPWRTTECVTPKMNRTCPYFNNHIPDFPLPTKEDPSMQDAEDYVKELNIL